MSIRSVDLSRWPLPPSSSPQERVRLCLPHYQAWPVMPVHNEWLLSVSRAYGFDDEGGGGVGGVLRHLIYTANSEPKAIKKLIFRTVRCLHCHVGARAGQHPKIDLGTTGGGEDEEKDDNDNDNDNDNKTNPPTRIAIHTFHYEWLRRVTESCGIASVEKCVRIVIDYYQSRIKQALHSDGPEAASEKELELFGRNRGDDPGFLAALGRSLRETAPANTGSANANAGASGDDPSACSQEDAARALERCQVGRNSASYARARNETEAETMARREGEMAVENSAATRRAREEIRRALGSPMG